VCDNGQRADDLVQATLTKLYVRWSRVRTVSHPDAYARTVLVREFIHEQRSPWAKCVSLTGEMTDPRPPRRVTGRDDKPLLVPAPDGGVPCGRPP
jgi:DNA-directed RNA polymerase specialized sigma24 family protein